MPNKAEKILLAAFGDWPTTEFTAEDLVVACWKQYPEDFGLQGYQNDHPDSNTVYRYIMGQRSIVKKDKWLHQVGSKLYRVSTKGAQHAVELVDSSDASPDALLDHRIRIDRARETVLSRLISTRAWSKWQSGDEIVFREACAFWGITARSAREDYLFARNEMEAAFSLAKSRLSSHASPFIYLAESKAELTSEALGQLHGLDARLQEKFADELAAIAQRVVARGRMKPRQ